MQTPVNTTLCIHHNDADGRASAAIVRKSLGTDLHLYEMDYGDILPWEKIGVADTIIIVDFSLPFDVMKTLSNYHKIIWIDHHKTAIDELESLSRDWPGYRDISSAACVLTWVYFFPDQPVPRAITLIGDRDTWKMAEKDTIQFNEGLHQKYTCPTNDQLWDPLLKNDEKYIDQLISSGAIIYDARLREIRRNTRQFGFPVLFEGHQTLAINKKSTGDLGQHIRDLGYQVGYCYADKRKNGQLTTYVTLYSAEVDVSIIASKFGGGGHRGAAGFSFIRGSSPFPPEANVEELDSETINH